MIRELISAAAVRLAAAAICGAQGTPAAPATVTVHGVVFDSMHAVPLEGATVTMTGSSDVAMSDGNGRFNFLAVAPGPHTFVAYHPAVDSAGFAALSARVTIVDEQTAVALTLPSFRTLWERICPGPFSADSGFVTGVVRDAGTRRVVAGAAVNLVWIETKIDSTKHVKQRRWRVSAVSDSGGAYALCGIPLDNVPNIQAVAHNATSGVIDLVGDSVRLRRRDLYIGASEASARGTIVGTTLRSDGSPFPDARVALEGSSEIRSDKQGHFLIHDVPAGTRELEVLALGVAPTTLTVDVLAADTAFVNVTLRKLTTLDVVRVIGSATQRRVLRDIDDRRKMGWGHFADSTQIKGATLAGAMTTFPSVDVRRLRNGNQFVVTLPQGANRCVANLFLDGVRQGGVQPDATTFSILEDLSPDDIALVEVYAHGETTPMEFQSPWSSCGSIAVWTKWALRR